MDRLRHTAAAHTKHKTDARCALRSPMHRKLPRSLSVPQRVSPNPCARCGLRADTLGEAREKRARDLDWRESSLGPSHHFICPANMMPAQRVDPKNWGPQVEGRQAAHTIGLGASHGKLKETWATQTWRNQLSDDTIRSSRPIRVDTDPARHVVYDHTTGGKIPGRPAGGDRSHGGLLAQRGAAFYY